MFNNDHDHANRHHPYGSFSLRCKNAPGYKQQTLTDLSSLLSIIKIEVPWYFQPPRPHLVPHKLLLLNDILNNKNTKTFSASLNCNLGVY